MNTLYWSIACSVVNSNRAWKHTARLYVERTPIKYFILNCIFSVYVIVFYIIVKSYNVKFIILKSNIQWHLVHSLCCATTTSTWFWNIILILPKTPYPLGSYFLLPSSQHPLASTNLSVSRNLPEIFHINEVIRDISHKWNHTYWVWLLLLSMFLRFTHTVACISTSLLLQLGNISLYR